MKTETLNIESAEKYCAEKWNTLYYVFSLDRETYGEGHESARTSDARREAVASIETLEHLTGTMWYYDSVNDCMHRTDKKVLHFL